MRYGVAHLDFLAALYAGNDISHISCRQLGAGLHVEPENAYLVGMVFLARGHELHEIVFADGAVLDFEVGDDSAEGVEHRVEDKCLQRCRLVAFGCGDALDDGAKDFLDAGAGFSAGADNLFAAAAYEFHNLVLDFLGLCRIEVDLVDYGNNLQVVVDGHVEVGYCLCLYALRSVDNQQRTLAGGDGTRHFVGKVDVSGSVDQIEGIMGAFEDIVHLYGMALDGDTSFALQVHVVEHLGFHVLGGNSISVLQQSVGQGAFAVVDVGNDAEVADILHLEQ